MTEQTWVRRLRERLAVGLLWVVLPVALAWAVLLVAGVGWLAAALVLPVE